MMSFCWHWSLCLWRIETVFQSHHTSRAHWGDDTSHKASSSLKCCSGRAGAAPKSAPLSLRRDLLTRINTVKTFLHKWRTVQAAVSQRFFLSLLFRQKTHLVEIFSKGLTGGAYTCCTDVKSTCLQSALDNMQIYKLYQPCNDQSFLPHRAFTSLKQTIELTGCVIPPLHLPSPSHPISCHSKNRALSH